MKMNKFFTFALASLAFAACSNDDEANSGAIDGQVGNPTWVTFKVVEEGTVPSTRGITGDDADEPTNEAAKIEKGHIYVFANNVWEQTIPFTGTTSEVTQITTGNKLFVVLANRPEITGLTTGTNFSVFRGKVETANTGLALVTNLMKVETANSWLLSNSLDGYTAAVASGSFESPAREVIEATKEDVEGVAAKNNFIIKLNRAVARSKFAISPAAGTAAAISAKKDGAEVAKVTGLNMHFSNLAKTTTTFLQTDASQVASPFYKAGFLDNAEILTKIDQSGTFAAIPAVYTYLPENTYNNPKYGQATNIYLKGTYAPKTVIKGYVGKGIAGSGTVSATLVAGESFVYDDLTDTYFILKIGGGYTLDGNQIPSTTITEALKAVNTIWVSLATDMGLYDVVKDYGSWSREAGATLADGELVWPTWDEIVADGAGTGARAKVNPIAAKDGKFYLGRMYIMRSFTAGEARYRIYLTDNDIDGLKGYKSVIRNYSYNVTLNGITGPGIADDETYPGGSTEQKPGGGTGTEEDPYKPGEGENGGEPEEPIDPSKSTYIKATIQIKPWVKVDQGAIVG